MDLKFKLCFYIQYSRLNGKFVPDFLLKYLREKRLTQQKP